MPGRLELRLLGPPEIRIDDLSLTRSISGKAQAILYYLAVTGRPQIRPTLAGLLWPDMPEEAARTNLRKALSDLRKYVAPYLTIERDLVAFNPEADYQVDVVEFKAALEDLKSLKTTSSREDIRPADIERLQAAVELYRGEFLSGFSILNAADFELWLLAEQARLRELAVEALFTLADCYAERGELTQGIACTRRLLELEPWREEAHRQLMLLLAQHGQRGAALAHYETCRQILAEELAVEPGPETVALFEQIRAGSLSRRTVEHSPSVVSPAPAQTQAPLLNFPAQPTPFIGRDRELADIIRRLQDPACRLLTLAGPGGIGKTRLAIQTAQSIHDLQPASISFEHGFLFAPLAPVSSAGELVAAVAGAANFGFYSNVPPKQQLLDYLRDKKMLLVLDNFEHLLTPQNRQQETLALVAELLAVAPAIKILVTSREALNLQEEWFHPIGGLSLPGIEPGLTETPEEEAPDRAAALEASDAVRLFVQSARRVKINFSLAAEQANVIKICRLVEGMPLGIELAAAWLKLLPAKKIAHELERSFDILTSRQQNVPERHRSMRLVFEHSWQMLSPAEQAVLEQLSVFQAGFHQEAAEQVTGASLLILVTLVEKSLLRVDDRGRYQMHELLRQFATEKLSAKPEAEMAARARHSGYYLAFLKVRAGKLASQAQQTTLAEIEQEIDNIRLGWLWAVRQNDLESIDQTLDTLYSFYQIRGRYQEGRDIFDDTAHRLQQPPTGAHQPRFRAARARLLARAGAFCYALGDFDSASNNLQASLDIGEEPVEQAFAFTMLGKVARLQGKKALAEEQLGRALALSRKIGDQTGEAEALHGLAEVAGTYAEHARGKALAAESLAISRRLGRPDMIAQALSSLAWSTNCLGGYDEAEAYWRECLAICREIGDRHGIALAQNHLGWSAWCAGEKRLTEALDWYRSALLNFREVGNRWNLSMCLADLAVVMNELQEYEQAKRYGQEGLTISEAVGNLDLVTYALCNLGMTEVGLGDFRAARRHLVRAIKIGWETQITGHLLNAIYYYACLLFQETLKEADGESNAAGEAESLKRKKRVRALTLTGFAIAQPAFWQALRDRAVRLQTELEAVLPAELVAEAKAAGQRQTLEEVLAEILAEVES